MSKPFKRVLPPFNDNYELLRKAIAKAKQTPHKIIKYFKELGDPSKEISLRQVFPHKTPPKIITYWDDLVGSHITIFIPQYGYNPMEGIVMSLREEYLNIGLTNGSELEININNYTFDQKMRIRRKTKKNVHVSENGMNALPFFGLFAMIFFSCTRV